MARSFSLDAVRDGVTNRTEELNKNAEPHSVEDDTPDRRRPVSYEHSDYDRTEAPKDDMRKYWRQFETTPIVRKPITSFASRVTEPGYYIESRELDEGEIRQLGDWLNQCAIIGGQPGKDFRQIAKKAIVQREVRGTALVELAPHKDDEDRIAGLKLINPEVCEAVTRPQQSLLIRPDDGDRYPDAPDAETGGKAAWLQDVVEAREVDWGVSERIRNGMGDADDDLKIGFRRDEIVPLRRDEDIGEVFGTSRIEAVSPRIEGLKQKLDDNDQAIASKAYPLWLFLFGDPETTGVWGSDDIDEFMNSHEMDNFHPGMKQGVRGDVSVETISGEVSDIAEYLNFDIQWIMSSMPMPMLSLGAFGDISGTTGQVAGVSQQQDVNRQIREARMEIEEEFTSVIRRVAQQQGIGEEAAKTIDLKIGDPSDPDPDTPRSQQIIRYVSDANGGETERPSQESQPTPAQQPQANAPAGQSGQNQSEQPQSGSDKGLSNPFADLEQIDSAAAQVWDERHSSAQLAQSSERSTLAQSVSSLLRNVRDETLDLVEESYSSTPQFAAIEFENIANRQLNTAIRNTQLKKESRKTFDELVEDVANDYGNSNTTFSKRQNVRFYAQTFENAVRDAAEEMLRRARVLIRDGVVSGEQWSDVRARVAQTYDDATIDNRANLIAHMELARARETTKFQGFEADPSIVGVRVHNPDASARVTQQLHGAEAYFEKGEIDNQLAQSVNERVLREGFDPLPRTPPYHFQDTTELQPIYE